MPARSAQAAVMLDAYYFTVQNNVQNKLNVLLII